MLLYILKAKKIPEAEKIAPKIVTKYLWLISKTENTIIPNPEKKNINGNNLKQHPVEI